MNELSTGEREIRHFFKDQEWADFNEIIVDLALASEDILGVLCVGSLVQQPGIPEGHFAHPPTTLGAVYDEFIRRPGRRKLHHSKSSDFDIWICNRDGVGVEGKEDDINQRGIELLNTMVANPAMRTGITLARKKYAFFDEYYKKAHLYTDEWRNEEPQEPWMANNFKMALEARIEKYLPGVIGNVHALLEQTIPGTFLEVRAFPESAFHLRPNLHVVDGAHDRSPFPRIANPQWIDISHNAHVFYAADELSIHPFKAGGRVLGQAIEEHLQSDEQQVAA